MDEAVQKRGAAVLVHVHNGVGGTEEVDKGGVDRGEIARGLDDGEDGVAPRVGGVGLVGVF